MQRMHRRRGENEATSMSRLDARRGVFGDIQATFVADHVGDLTAELLPAGH
jgi:hypothetical protein